jgi:hypothetical protein
MAGATFAPAGATFAGPPDPPNCLGKFFSFGAGDRPPGLIGEGATFYAKFPDELDGQPGLGVHLQLHQAGLVPDFILPNFCDDPDLIP